MAVTLRQQIVDAIKARLALIRTTGGYATDLGARVFFNRSSPLAQKDLPALMVIEGDANKSTGGVPIGQVEHRLEFTVEAYASGADVDSYLRLADADISKVLMADRRWGGLAEDTDLGNTSAPGIDQNETITGGIAVPFAVTYRTPYGQT